MRTITVKLKKQLEAQKQEAQTLGLTKVASSIESQLADQNTRENTDFYTYASSDLVNDVEYFLNKAALRIQDYFDKAEDQVAVAKVVEVFAQDFINSFSRKEILGPFEPSVPGELKEITEIEIE